MNGPPKRAKQTTIAAAAVALVLATGVALVAWLPQRWQPAAGSGAVGVERRADVRVVTDDIPRSTWPAVTYSKLAESDAAAREGYLAMLEKEIALYPPAFIDESGLRVIAVVKDLAYAGQPRAALPDPYVGVLYLDALLGRAFPVYQRHVIHHEYFHFVQGKRFGDPYVRDPKWMSFNPPGFRYGKGGVTARDASVTPLNHPAAGFVNAYAQSAPEEDMAEVFAALRVPEERALLLEWAREDDVLRRKIEYLEEFFESYGREGAAARSTEMRPTESPMTVGR